MPLHCSWKNQFATAIKHRELRQLQTRYVKKSQLEILPASLSMLRGEKTNKPKTLDCTHYHTVCEEWTYKWMWGQKCFFQRIYVWRQLLPLFCLSKAHDIKCETSYRLLFCNYVCIFQGSCRVCWTKVERIRERESVCTECKGVRGWVRMISYSNM